MLIVGQSGTLARQAMEVEALLGHAPVAVPNLNEVPSEGDDVFVALDDAVARAQAIDELVAAGTPPVTLVHPTAFVSPTAQLGHNVMIGAQCFVAMDAVVGNGVTLSALSTVEHDNSIGDHVFLGTGVVLCGRITIGARSFIGGGVTIKPGTTIAPDTIIGTGAVVVHDTEPGLTYVGNPARVLG